MDLATLYSLYSSQITKVIRMKQFLLVYSHSIQRETVVFTGWVYRLFTNTVQMLFRPDALPVSTNGLYRICTTDQLFMEHAF